MLFFPRGHLALVDAAKENMSSIRMGMRRLWEAGSLAVAKPEKQWKAAPAC